ncbi:hypothetical protein WDU94_007663 [Cyamophila willieti]
MDLEINTNATPSAPFYWSEQPRSSKENDNETEYSEDYNFLNYITEMTKYILAKRKMLTNPTEDIQSKRKQYMLELKAKEAQAKKKVYCLFGYYPAVRYQFGLEGWVEKQNKEKTKYDVPLRKEFTATQVIYLDSAPLIMKMEVPQGVNTEFVERKFISEKLEDKPDLVFSLRKNLIAWSSLSEDTIVSYFPQCNFCSKLGLNECLSHMSSFKCKNDSLRFPRGYNLINKTCMRRFTQDFRETCCFSLMRFIKLCVEKNKLIHSLDGTVPVSTFDFAEKVCKKKIQSLQLENVGDNTPDRYTVDETTEEEDHWAVIEENIFNLINQRYVFQYIQDFNDIVQRARNLVDGIDECKKQEICDGIYNVWVVKPVANCSGYGIRLFRRLNDITKAVLPFSNNNYGRFVVQKYIERPLLIYGVKFDLRVWYLVTSINQFKLWVYHEGYVRFCSKPHSNLVLDEMRHLTNVRIQRKYRSKREPSHLPPELMWDFKQLKDYFTNYLSLPKTWDNIMKAMEESIQTIMQCAMNFNHIGLRKNTFQLFGADFLINENFRPCLIEVNNGPGLSPTTSIIAKKTTSLLIDIVKVITSEKDQPKTYVHPIDHGNFHLIYTKEMTSPRTRELTDMTHIKHGMLAKQVNVLDWKRNARVRKPLKNILVKPKTSTI